MRTLQLAVVTTLAAVIMVVTSAPASAEVQLSIKDGRVTLVAKDATVRQILAEWARVGQTKIVNAERVPGGPLTLQLTDVPEQQALDILLRSVSGYLAAPRPTAVSTLSRYDRILVMPTAAAARQPVSGASAVFQQQPQMAMPSPSDQTADDGAVTATLSPARGPVFTTFQQPPAAGSVPPATTGNAQTPVIIGGIVTQGVPPAGDQETPGPAAPNASFPSAPFPNATPPTSGTGVVGSPRPGMVIPVPVPTAQPPTAGQ